MSVDRNIITSKLIENCQTPYGEEYLVNALVIAALLGEGGVTTIVKCPHKLKIRTGLGNARPVCKPREVVSMSAEELHINELREKEALHSVKFRNCIYG